ncbi:protein takeout-like [Onthophagus taurus]|uniref:protein takeout-like n=1 Tax=Onthophagus taurus TaxID=166361 RepID=UPI0039BE5025
MFKTVFLVVQLTFLVNSLKLPSYLNQCSFSDPNLNDCIKINGNKAISSLVKGDAKYKIIDLKPFKSPKIVLDSGKHLKIVLTDVTVNNLDHLVLNEIKFDKSKPGLYFKGSIDDLSLEGLYNMTGQILVLPLNGEGNVEATLHEGEYVYEITMDVITKKNTDYYKIKSSKVDYVLKRGYFHFDNLFNGNKELGDRMNQFIDENWTVIADEIKPALAETIRSVVDSVFSGYFSTVPIKDIFSDYTK